MNGITSWNELIAKEKVKYGVMKKMSCNFAIGLLFEGRHYAEQVVWSYYPYLISITWLFGT
jgi:hypothetical protein